MLRNEMAIREYDETLDLLEEWFAIHHKMDFANRTKQVKRDWQALKLAKQKSLFSVEQERAETDRIRLCMSELIKLVKYSGKI